LAQEGLIVPWCCSNPGSTPDNRHLPGRGQKERLVAVLEMTSLSQSMRDHILQMLENNGGKMERAFLRRRLGWRYAILDPILEDLGDGRQD